MYAPVLINYLLLDIVLKPRVFDCFVQDTFLNQFQNIELLRLCDFISVHLPQVGLVVPVVHTIARCLGLLCDAAPVHFRLTHLLFQHLRLPQLLYIHSPTLFGEYVVYDRIQYHFCVWKTVLDLRHCGWCG